MRSPCFGSLARDNSAIQIWPPSSPNGWSRGPELSFSIFIFRSCSHLLRPDFHLFAAASTPSISILTEFESSDLRSEPALIVKTAFSYRTGASLLVLWRRQV